MKKPIEATRIDALTRYHTTSIKKRAPDDKEKFFAQIEIISDDGYIHLAIDEEFEDKVTIKGVVKESALKSKGVRDAIEKLLEVLK